MIDSANQIEDWYTISKRNETTYDVSLIDLNSSTSTKWAMVVSLVIAMIIGLSMDLIVVYGANKIYVAIISQVNSTSKYSQIEKKDDTGAATPLMELTPEDEIQGKK